MSKTDTAFQTMEHSPLGASSADRWMQCPGSVALSKNLTSTSSSYAEEGTLAHKVASDILEGKPGTYTGLPDDMLPAVMEYVTHVNALCTKDAFMRVEERFHLEAIHPMLFGTADCVIYHTKTKLLQVIDYKHGAGIAVEVEHNKQLMYYALGALLKLGKPCTKVEITVAQPRCFHPDGAIRSWEIDPIDLMDFGGDLRNAALETEKPDAAVNPGSWCRWCPAKALCPALASQANALAKEEFRDGLSYDPVKLGLALSKVPALEAYISGLHEFAYAEATRGVEIPGWKLVAKRGTRKWADEQDAKVAARSSAEVTPAEFDNLFETKLKSPAQAKIALGAEKFARVMEPHVVSISSGSTLVPESDKRAPMKEVIASVFDDHLKTLKLVE